jgi:hypothetical protein
VNIASTAESGWQPGGPWDAQASLVKSLTDARHDVATASLLSALYLPDHATTRSLAKAAAPADESIAQLQRRAAGPQRRAAAPQTYKFVLKRAVAGAEKR